MGREVIKEKFMIGNPFDASILDRKHLSRMRSHEFIFGQVSLHKGSTLLREKIS